MTDESNKSRPILGALFLFIGLAVAATFAYQLVEGPRRAINNEINQAIELGRSGSYDDAIAKLEALVAQHPDNADALFNYGVALEAKQKWDEADAVFVRVLKAKPDDWAAVAERAACARMKGDLDKAFDILDGVPPGQDVLRRRLSGEPIWLELQNHARMRTIRGKQGLGNLTYQ